MEKTSFGQTSETEHILTKTVLCLKMSLIQLNKAVLEFGSIFAEICKKSLVKVKKATISKAKNY